MPKQVLVVDEDEAVAETLRHRLPGTGYAISTIDPQGALRRVSRESPDLIVLDGLLAPAEAVELAQHLRHRASGARVVAVVPSGDLACDAPGVTCVNGVPTEEELVAWLGDEGERREERVLRVGKLTLDLDSRRLDANGEVTVLTPKQFRLLSLFMSHPGKVLTRKQIMREVWDTDYTGDTRTLDVHIHWVREKLGDVPGEPKYLHTVRRVGYRLDDPDSVTAATPEEPK